MTEGRVLLTVLRGEPTPEQLAALVAVLSARSGCDDVPARTSSTWAARGTALRRELVAGPGAWRASGRPH